MPILEGVKSGGGPAPLPLTADGTKVAVDVSATVSVDTSVLAKSAAQTDGTQKTQQVDGSGNVAPAGDTVARASFVKVTNGTQTMPTGDAAARPVFVEVSDGAAAVALATSTKQSDGSQKTQIVDSAGTHTMPAGDAATRPVFVELTDGTTAVAVATSALQTIGNTSLASLVTAQTDGTQKVKTSLPTGTHGGADLATGASSAAFASQATTIGYIFVTALLANTAAVYLARNTSVTTSTGIELNPGDSIPLPCANANEWFAISAATQHLRVVAV